MRTLDHIGIPTNEPQAGEMYNEGMKLYLTDYSKSPNHIEWLRFDADSWMHERLQKHAHIAYQVTDPEAEMRGKTVLLPPTDCGDGKWIAFVEEEGIGVELMWQVK